MTRIVRRLFGQLLTRLRRPLKTLPSLEAYALWSASYPPHAHNALMLAEEEAMRALLPALEGRAVLDLASGTGRYGRIASDQGAAQIAALDNSLPMLRHNPLDHRVQATLQALPFGARTFDVVLCGLAVGHVASLDGVLAEMARVLRPGGVALVSDFHPLLFLRGGRRTFSAPDGRMYAVEHHVHLRTDYERAALGAGLAIDSVLESDVSMPAQAGSAGDSLGAPAVIVWKLNKQE